MHSKYTLHDVNTMQNSGDQPRMRLGSHTSGTIRVIALPYKRFGPNYDPIVLASPLIPIKSVSASIHAVKARPMLKPALEARSPIPSEATHWKDNVEHCSVFCVCSSYELDKLRREELHRSAATAV